MMAMAVGSSDGAQSSIKFCWTQDTYRNWGNNLPARQLLHSTYVRMFWRGGGWDWWGEVSWAKWMCGLCVWHLTHPLVPLLFPLNFPFPPSCFLLLDGSSMTSTSSGSTSKSSPLIAAEAVTACSGESPSLNFCYRYCHGCPQCVDLTRSVQFALWVETAWNWHVYYVDKTLFPWALKLVNERISKYTSAVSSDEWRNECVVQVNM